MVAKILLILFSAMHSNDGDWKWSWHCELCISTMMMRMISCERKKELRPTWNAPRFDYIYPAQRTLFLTWLRIIITDSHLHEYLMVSHQLNRNGYQSVRGRYVARLLLNFFFHSVLVHLISFIGVRNAQGTNFQMNANTTIKKERHTNQSAGVRFSFLSCFIRKYFCFSTSFFVALLIIFAVCFTLTEETLTERKKKQNRNDTELSDHFVMSSHKMCSQME